MRKPDFVGVLEDNWEIIRDEFLRTGSDLWDYSDNHEPPLNPERKWKVMPLYAWPFGEPFDQFVGELPILKQLVDDHIPNRRAVSISVLKAGGFIPSHEGRKDGCLRLHLGLQIPIGDTGICVEGKIYNWKNGECFIFDDSKEHFAWNRTDQDRVILLIDFLP